MIYPLFTIFVPDKSLFPAVYEVRAKKSQIFLLSLHTQQEKVIYPCYG
jgi:hypothetical protein